MTVRRPTPGFVTTLGLPPAIRMSRVTRAGDLVQDDSTGPRTTSRRGPDHADDAGSASIIAVVVMFALLAMVGLVVDGGGRVAAAITADNAAAAAARAGGQAIDTTAVLAGRPIVADPMAAAAAARAHLRAAGVAGEARVEPGGRTIVVTTSVTYEPVFLGLLGVGRTRVTGTARASLVDLRVGYPGAGS